VYSNYTKEDDGKYSVLFPDIENCFTGGDDMADAIDMAEDALRLMLYDMEQDKKEIFSGVLQEALKKYLQIQ